MNVPALVKQRLLLEVVSVRCRWAPEAQCIDVLSNVTEYVVGLQTYNVGFGAKRPGTMLLAS